VLAQARRQHGHAGERGGTATELVRRLLMLRGDLLAHTLPAEEAEASYREALALAEAASERARITVRLAHSLAQRGQAGEALRLCRQAAEMLPLDEVALLAELSAAESQALVALTDDAAEAFGDGP
jgi:tetratricopeptide (TPR) repeat protein